MAIPIFRVVIVKFVCFWFPCFRLSSYKTIHHTYLSSKSGRICNTKAVLENELVCLSPQPASQDNVVYRKFDLNWNVNVAGDLKTICKSLFLWPTLNKMTIYYSGELKTEIRY